ncbi:hypothetical protein QWA68_005174 [Fusarium oxysporum]|nr:hypothetical protein QWA68_005174 [Fusarium oxysporum]
MQTRAMTERAWSFPTSNNDSTIRTLPEFLSWVPLVSSDVTVQPPQATP